MNNEKTQKPTYMTYNTHTR